MSRPEYIELTSEDKTAVFVLDVDMQQVKFARFGQGNDGSESTPWVTLTCGKDEDEDAEAHNEAEHEGHDIQVNIVNPSVQVKIPRSLAPYLCPLVEYYGWHVPRWYFFAGLQNRSATIDPKVFARVAELAKRWTRSEAEILGQVVGWLGWQVDYQRDHSFVAITNASSSKLKASDTESVAKLKDKAPKLKDAASVAATKGKWVAADEFDHPLVQVDLAMSKTRSIKGDCEDIAILHNTCFEQVPVSLCPIKSRYCFFNVDTAISSDTFHSCSVLVPWSILRSEWLSVDLAKALPLNDAPDSESKNVYDLPILVIESTDMTLTEFSLRLDNDKNSLKRRIHEDLWQKERFTEDQFSYPFPDVSYQAQGYFKTFLFAYSPQLLAFTGVGAWQLMQRESQTLGVSLEQLVHAYGVSLVPRQPVSAAQLDDAKAFFKSRVPRLGDFKPFTTEPLPPVSATISTESSIPVYSSIKPLPDTPGQWYDLSRSGLTWRKHLFVQYI